MYNRITLRQLQRMAPSVSLTILFNTRLIVFIVLFESTSENMVLVDSLETPVGQNLSRHLF